MFTATPTNPMMKTSSGLSTSSGRMNLSIDCRKMLTPSARMKTLLKKAPRRSALFQPKVKLDGDVFLFFSRNAIRATMKVMRSFKQWNASATSASDRVLKPMEICATKKEHDIAITIFARVSCDTLYLPILRNFR